MSNIDVKQIAQEINARLEPKYRDSILPAYKAAADDDGKISRTGVMTVEIEMLRQYLELYVTELVSEVVRRIDEA
ncbi:hypothetical protein [Paenibacillus tengchongensis]|uniref:hypothetical protein n=1 Tax=Paenibacillus tengchongensis TaxID=2608684 RepID=UPI00124EF1F5|nr:hypothetical protein [Paenibacillus tengchongensis]